MRTIRFKGKRRDNGEWVSGDLAHSLNGNLNILAFDTQDGVVGFTGVYPIDPSTVCLFTGMKDIEGNEVWEGDILDGQLNGEVVFTSGTFALHPIDCKVKEVFAPLYYFYIGNRTLDLKVIGNKFDK